MILALASSASAAPESMPPAVACFDKGIHIAAELDWQGIDLMTECLRKLPQADWAVLDGYMGKPYKDATGRPHTAQRVDWVISNARTAARHLEDEAKYQGDNIPTPLRGELSYLRPNSGGNVFGADSAAAALATLPPTVDGFIDCVEVCAIFPRDPKQPVLVYTPKAGGRSDIIDWYEATRALMTHYRMDTLAVLTLVDGAPSWESRVMAHGGAKGERQGDYTIFTY